ncbi:MAG TPA: hypothetical protein PK849_02910, partial [Synergistales bacterium]|nr:hypothetical protein [Synergistales bacterium]
VDHCVHDLRAVFRQVEGEDLVSEGDDVLRERFRLFFPGELPVDEKKQPVGGLPVEDGRNAAATP